jgi:hypothetical protein
MTREAVILFTAFIIHMPRQVKSITGMVYWVIVTLALAHFLEYGKMKTILFQSRATVIARKRTAVMTLIHL